MKLQLILVCLMTMDATTSILCAADNSETTPLEEFMKSLDNMQKRQQAKVTLQIQMANEIRRQRAGAHAEVLFWLRTLPAERVFSKKKVPQMLQSDGYSQTAVEGIIGISNPLFMSCSKESS